MTDNMPQPKQNKPGASKNLNAPCFVEKEKKKNWETSQRLLW